MQGLSVALGHQQVTRLHGVPCRGPGQIAALTEAQTGEQLGGAGFRLGKLWSSQHSSFAEYSRWLAPPEPAVHASLPETSLCCLENDVSLLPPSIKNCVLEMTLEVLIPGSNAPIFWGSWPGAWPGHQHLFQVLQPTRMCGQCWGPLTGAVLWEQMWLCAQCPFSPFYLRGAGWLGAPATDCISSFRRSKVWLCDLFLWVTMRSASFSPFPRAVEETQNKGCSSSRTDESLSTKGSDTRAAQGRGHWQAPPFVLLQGRQIKFHQFEPLRFLVFLLKQLSLYIPGKALLLLLNKRWTPQSCEELEKCSGPTSALASCHVWGQKRASVVFMEFLFACF